MEVELQLLIEGFQNAEYSFRVFSTVCFLKRMERRGNDESYKEPNSNNVF